jgi:hypothetical protein
MDNKSRDIMRHPVRASALLLTTALTLTVGARIAQFCNIVDKFPWETHTQTKIDDKTIDIMKRMVSDDSQANSGDLQYIWDTYCKNIFKEAKAIALDRVPYTVLKDNSLTVPAQYNGTIKYSPQMVNMTRYLYGKKWVAAVLLVVIHELMHHWQHQNGSTLERCDSEAQATALTALVSSTIQCDKSSCIGVHNRGAYMLQAMQDARLLSSHLSVAKCYCRRVNAAIQAAIQKSSDFNGAFLALTTNDVYASTDGTHV